MCAAGAGAAPPFRPAIFSDRQYCIRLLHNAKAQALTFRLAHQTDVDFPIDVPPFLCLSKRSTTKLAC
jgi:hypothetical protein